MLLADRIVDLAGFSVEERIAFYKYGYAWALEMKTWDQAELDTLEERFQKLRPGLERLIHGEGSESARYGGPEAAQVVAAFVQQARPVIQSIRAEHEAGHLPQDLTHLFWSYAHMMTNRLGVEATPEAILRYFMFRLLQERAKTHA